MPVHRTALLLPFGLKSWLYAVTRAVACQKPRDVTEFIATYCQELYEFRKEHPGLNIHDLTHLFREVKEGEPASRTSPGSSGSTQDHQAIYNEWKNLSAERMLSITSFTRDEITQTYEISSLMQNMDHSETQMKQSLVVSEVHTHVSDTAVVEQLRPCVLGLSNDSGLDSNLKITELTTEKETEPRAPQNIPVPTGEESDSQAASDVTTDLMLTVTSSTEKLTDGEIHHEHLQQAMEELPELNLEKHDGQGLGKSLSEVTVNEAASFVGGNLTDQPLGQDLLETWGGATVTKYLEGIQSNVEEDLSHTHDTESKVSSVYSTSTEPSLEAVLFSLSEDSPEEIIPNAEMQMDNRVLATGVEHQEDRETSLKSPEKEQPLRMCPESFLTNETGPVTTGSDLKISLSTDEQLIDAKLLQSCELERPHYEVPEAVLEDNEYVHTHVSDTAVVEHLRPCVLGLSNDSNLDSNLKITELTTKKETEPRAPQNIPAPTGEESDSLAASDVTTDLMLTVTSSTEKLTDGEIHRELLQQAMEELPELNLEKHDGQGLGKSLSEVTVNEDASFVGGNLTDQPLGQDFLETWGGATVTEYLEEIQSNVEEDLSHIHDTESKVSSVCSTSTEPSLEALLFSLSKDSPIPNAEMQMDHRVVATRVEHQEDRETSFKSPEKEQPLRMWPESFLTNETGPVTTGSDLKISPSTDEQLIDAKLHQSCALERPQYEVPEAVTEDNEYALECTFEPVPSMDEQFIDAENNQQGEPDHLHQDKVPEPILVEHDSGICEEEILASSAKDKTSCSPETIRHTVDDGSAHKHGQLSTKELSLSCSADLLLETSSRVHLEVLETIDSRMREAVYSEVPSVVSVSEAKMEMGHQVVLQQSTWEALFESPEKEQAFRVSPELLIVYKDATETTGPAFDLVLSSDEELIDADIHQLGELENPELSLQKHDTGAVSLLVSETSEEVSSPSSAGKETASSSEAVVHTVAVSDKGSSTHELLQAEETGEKTFPSRSEALQTHDSELPCLSGELGGTFPEAEMYMKHRVDHQEDSWEAPLETPEKEDSLIAALEQFLTNDDGQTTTGSVYQMLQQLNKNEIHQENELEYDQHQVPEPRLEQCASGATSAPSLDANKTSEPDVSREDIKEATREVTEKHLDSTHLSLDLKLQPERSQRTEPVYLQPFTRMDQSATKTEIHIMITTSPDCESERLEEDRQQSFSAGSKPTESQGTQGGILPEVLQQQQMRDASTPTDYVSTTNDPAFESLASQVWTLYHLAQATDTGSLPLKTQVSLQTSDSGSEFKTAGPLHDSGIDLSECQREQAFISPHFTMAADAEAISIPNYLLVSNEDKSSDLENEAHEKDETSQTQAQKRAGCLSFTFPVESSGEWSSQIQMLQTKNSDGNVVYSPGYIHMDYMNNDTRGDSQTTPPDSVRNMEWMLHTSLRDDIPAEFSTSGPEKGNTSDQK